MPPTPTPTLSPAVHAFLTTLALDPDDLQDFLTYCTTSPRGTDPATATAAEIRAAHARYQWQGVDTAPAPPTPPIITSHNGTDYYITPALFRFLRSAAMSEADESDFLDYIRHGLASGTADGMSIPALHAVWRAQRGSSAAVRENTTDMDDMRELRQMEAWLGVGQRIDEVEARWGAEWEVEEEEEEEEEEEVVEEVVEGGLYGWFPAVERR